jgi:hypothetical protein
MKSGNKGSGFSYPNLSCSSSICLEGLRKATKALCTMWSAEAQLESSECGASSRSSVYFEVVFKHYVICTNF